MFWLVFVFLLLLWVMSVAFTYVLFYYESANSPHLEVLRSRGSVPVMILRGFLWSLYSHLLVLVTADFCPWTLSQSHGLVPLSQMVSPLGLEPYESD